MTAPLPDLMPPAVPLPDELASLRGAVRAFVAEQIGRGAWQPQVDGWLSGWNPQFSKELAARGWVGMAIPQEYGGHGAGALARYVVIEELLAAGAPVAAHWMADRQIAPALLRHGTAAQRAEFLPRIASGDFFAAVALSEPDTGSDLASVRTRAVPVDWRMAADRDENLDLGRAPRRRDLRARPLRARRPAEPARGPVSVHRRPERRPECRCAPSRS